MTPTVDNSRERTEKQRRVTQLLDAHDLDTLVLRDPGNIAWFSGGGRAHIEATPAVGVADLVVTRDSVEVVTTVNEADRLAEEEFAELGAKWRVVGWHEDRDAALPAGDRVGADVPAAGMRDVAAALLASRAPLTPAEVERYRTLGRDTAAALTDTCERLSPEQTEYEAAAATARALLERRIDPVVLLVAGEERLPRHRHPLPTATPLNGLVMVIACGRRHGLIASITRFVAFSPLASDTRETERRLLGVDTAFNLATRPGASVADAFGAGVSAYAAEGFDPDEWRRHHQGGPTGYATRDYLAGPDSDATIADAQAFAWNPTVPGLKSEDTVIAAAEGPEVLTVDPRWPVTTVNGLARPLVLER